MISDMALSDSHKIYLEISEADRTQAWQQSQSFLSPSCQWNAYLNQLCLQAILPWLIEDYDLPAKVWPNQAVLPSFWEFVNGTAITFNATRLILIPSESIDLSELRVPQEWIDIPSWVADYYLAIQVNPDDQEVLIWGYTSYQQLKTKGTYNSQDRTYSLMAEDLIDDLNILWVSCQLDVAESTRVAVNSLPQLSLDQINQLLQRLGHLELIFPRQEVPFEQWGALLEHGGTRQQLYHRRLGISEPWSVSQWLSTGLSQIAQQMGWQQLEWQVSFAGARGAELTTNNSLLCRPLMIAGQPYELRVFPVKNAQMPVWRFELRNSTPGGLIPGGFKLRLLTEDLQDFENNEDVAQTAQELLYIEVSLSPNEGLVWEIEPLPENYDREVLRF
jgi:hypothetical protein